MKAPRVCFLPARACPEAIERAQDVITLFQRTQSAWADARLQLHGHLLSATMRTIQEELPALSTEDQRKLVPVRFSALPLELLAHLLIFFL